MNNEWKDRWDVIDNAPDHYVDIRPHWGLPQMSYLNFEKKQWAPRSMEGLWFNAYTWRLYRQTRLTTTPLLLLSEVGNKPYYVDGSVGKFRWDIPFDNE